MAEQTRPSAVARRPDPDTAVRDCTAVELMYEAVARTQARRNGIAEADFPEAAAGWIRRELSIAVTALEDAITRHNKAVYMERGIFAITDAERTGT